mmetsp:Transcript_120183/g.285567  ORF Transcript_120183/g.285567 Transcript_120183/m.285567 type:complete len:296 (-) Transcript_120183:307-1194(-)
MGDPPGRRPIHVELLVKDEVPGFAVGWILKRDGQRGAAVHRLAVRNQQEAKLLLEVLDHLLHKLDVVQKEGRILQLATGLALPTGRIVVASVIRDADVFERSIHEPLPQGLGCLRNLALIGRVHLGTVVLESLAERPLRLLRLVIRKPLYQLRLQAHLCAINEDVGRRGNSRLAGSTSPDILTVLRHTFGPARPVHRPASPDLVVVQAGPVPSFDLGYTYQIPRADCVQDLSVGRRCSTDRDARGMDAPVDTRRMLAGNIRLGNNSIVVLFGRHKLRQGRAPAWLPPAGQQPLHL